MVGLSLVAKDPPGCSQTDLLHVGDEAIEAAGIGNPVLHQRELLGFDPDTDSLARHLAGPLDVGSVGPRRGRHAAAPFGVASGVDGNEVSPQKEVDLSEGLLEGVEAGALAAEPRRVIGRGVNRHFSC